MAKRHRKWAPYVISAVLPLIFLIFAYIHLQGLPFTNKQTLLIIDMNQQYVDFYSMFRQTVLHGQWSNIFFSFNNGLGSDMWGIWAYYLCSPLNILLLFFKEHYLTSGIWCLMALKYMLVSLSMCTLLLHHGLHRRWVSLFSMIYAFNGWAVAYQLNLMWLDALIILPLIILGLDLLYETSSYSLYTVMIAVALIDNYYMGYMIILFSGIYFLYKWFGTKFINWKLRFLMVRSYLVSTFVGLLMSVWFWLPTFLQLQSSKASYHTNITFTWINTWQSLVFKTFSSSYSFQELQTGNANMYVTLPILILAVMYFFNKRYTLRERIASLVVLIILIFSITNSFPALIWQAFQNPIWYPYRFSYILSFWLVFLAAKQAMTGLYLSWKQFAATVFGITCWFILNIVLIDLCNPAYVNITNMTIDYIITLIIVGLLVYDGFFVISIWRWTCIFVLFLTMVFVNYVNMSNITTSWSETSYQAVMKDLNSMKNEDPDVNNKYRSVFFKYRSLNDYLHLGIHGMSEFSSTTDAKTSQFLQNLGLSQSSVTYGYLNGTAITNDLFGMHSLMDLNSKTLLQKNETHYDAELLYKKDMIGNVIRYTNTDALPVVFVSNKFDDDGTIGLSGQINHQITWLNQVAPGKSIVSRYKTLHPKRYFKTINGTKYQFMEYTYAGIPGMINYVEEPLNFNLGANSFYGNYTWSNNGRISHLPTRSTHDIVVSVDNQNMNTIVIKSKLDSQVKYPNLRLYSINPKVLHERVNKVVAQNKDTEISYDNTGKMQVDLTTNDKQSVYTSLSYNPNFYITDNGKHISGQVYNDALLSIPVSSGKHHIVIDYRVGGLAPAFIVSAIGIIIWLFWVVIDRRKYL